MLPVRHLAELNNLFGVSAEETMNASLTIAAKHSDVKSPDTIPINIALLNKTVEIDNLGNIATVGNAVDATTGSALIKTCTKHRS